MEHSAYQQVTLAHNDPADGEQGKLRAEELSELSPSLASRVPPEEKEIQRTSAQRRAAVRAAEADLAKVEQGLNRNKRRLDKFKNTAIKDLHEGKEGSLSQSVEGIDIIRITLDRLYEEFQNLRAQKEEKRLILVEARRLESPIDLTLSDGEDSVEEAVEGGQPVAGPSHGM